MINGKEALNMQDKKSGITLMVILLVIMVMLVGCEISSNSGSSNSSRKTTQRQSNPSIRDMDPEFYDYLERRYNNMIDRYYDQ